MAQLIEERLVELLNLASVEVDGNKKVEYLYQIKELALNHGLVDNFFQDILAFQNERAPNVKKFVLAFIEAACKIDCQLCPKAVLNLNLLLNDTNTDVTKRSIQAATQFYRALAQWIVSSQQQQQQHNQQLQQHQLQQQNQPQQPLSNINSTGLVGVDSSSSSSSSAPAAASIDSGQVIASDIEKTWLMWLQIKNQICNLLETTNNDGVRTHCIKFIETMVLIQTPRDKYTDSGHELNLIDPLITSIKLSNEALICGVVGLPKNGILFNEEHKLELVDAAKRSFEQLVVFHGTSHISSVNLMATMQSLVVLAKQRYRLFMGRVIQAMESLHNRLPPTLTESQVQSVKKFLKLQLTVMLKHPHSLDRYRLQITQLLQAVGSRQPEIHRVISDFKQKFGSETQAINSNANVDVQKRIKLEPGLKPPTTGSQAGSQPVPVGKSKHLDLNKLTQELDEKEKRQIVVDSVRRILGEEKRAHITPAQMEIKTKVLSTLANEFHNTECSKIIQDYIFGDLRNRQEICYAIIRKFYDVAATKASKRQINLSDHPELLNKFSDCYHSYLYRVMDMKDDDDLREDILDKLYKLRDKCVDPNQEQEDDKL